MLELKTNESVELSIDGKKVKLRKPNVMDIIQLDEAISKEGITNKESIEENKKFLESLGLPSGVFEKLTAQAQKALMEYLSDTPKK